MTFPSFITLAVGTHTVSIERVERLRWKVAVDGRRFASFCTESRARAAGRQEARRQDFSAVRRAAAAAPRAPGGGG